MALTATSGSGTQTATDNPQTSTQTPSLVGGQPISAVQPGIPSNSLNQSQGQVGVPLHNTVLPTVNLSSGTVQAQTVAAPPAHKTNTALIGLSVSLFVVAAIVFWAIWRSAKNTTNN